MSPPPAELDEYVLGAPLGAGSFGEVYVAHDRLLGRDVALKLLRHATQGPARERLLFEARALARLQHANVVTLYRVGEVGGRPYLVSELLRGRSLQQLARPVPRRQVLELALGIARGLAAVHRQGVLHRDLKPANVFLTDDGVVKLIDFGLARVPGELRSTPAPAEVAPAPVAAGVLVPARGGDTVDSEAQPTAAPRDLSAAPAPLAQGRVAGSPLYMAPEAWRGEAPTPATDVFGAGVILYELVAGALPRKSTTADALAREAQTDELPPLAVVSGDVDPRLAAIVDRCVKRNPLDRFADGDALRAELEALVTEHSGALPEGGPYRGLLAFEAEHGALFFGRGDEVRAVVDRLRSDPWVLITAESGAGKSSLCRAGVLPELARGALGRALPGVILVPGARPLAALAAALAGVLDRTDESVRCSLADDPLEVGRALKRRHADGVALLVDQLEELHTLSPRAEAAAFAHALTALAVDTRAVRCVATVRGDFLAQVLALPGFPDSLPRACWTLRPLGPAGLREAIERPAAARGFRFESDALVQRLVSSAQAGDGTLPLLQFALAELWDQRDVARGVISAEALDRVGGVEAALARHADAVLLALAPGPRRAAQHLLLELVSADGTRARRRRDELQRREPGADTALDALIRGRLVSSSGDESGAAVCQLTQEALISHWATLRGWLDSEAEHRLALARVERAAREWQRLGEPSELLLKGKQLLELEELPPPMVGALERRLMVSSRRAARIALLRRWLAGAAAVLAVGLAFVPLLKGRYDKGQRLDHLLRDSEQGRAAAEHAGQELRRLYARSLEAFDRRALDAAERDWADVRARVPPLEAAWAHEEKQLAEAAELDPLAKLGSARAATLVARVELLRLFRPWSAPAPLFERLAAIDPRGGAKAMLDAPAHVSLKLADGHTARLEREGQPAAVATAPRGDVLLSPGVWKLNVRGPTGAEAIDWLPVLDSAPLSVEVAGVPAAPAGFVYVPAGAYLIGSDDDDGLRRFFLRATPLHRSSTGAYFIARREVTFADYVEWLDALPKDEAERRRPEVQGLHAVSLTRGPKGWRLALTTSGQLHQAETGERLSWAGRAEGPIDWHQLPVTGVSLVDFQAFAGWLDATHRVPGARLCREAEWERATRGADGRRYPTGDALPEGAANIDVTWGRRPDAFGPDAVGARPLGASPFGLDDTAGNAWEMTLDQEGGGVLRGGGWYTSDLSAMSANREPLEPSYRDPVVGTRLCADVP